MRWFYWSIICVPAAAFVLLLVAAVLESVRGAPIFLTIGNPATTAYEMSIGGEGLGVRKVSGALPVTLGRGDVAGPLWAPGGWDRFGFHFHQWQEVKFDSKRVPLPGSYGNTSEFWMAFAWPSTLLPLLTAAALYRASRNQAFMRTVDRRHLCRRCGYDLRASPIRCPECGAAASKSTPS